MSYFFTSDEHYGHRNIIKYCNRPFKDVNEMDEVIISNHNEVVSPKDTVIHAGDFTLWKDFTGVHKKYVSRLNGNHIFLVGSHDYWLNGKLNPKRWERNISIDGKKYYFVVDHYAMRTWHKSHYNSFQLYGHSHGNLPPVGKQHDIGVDINNFYPVSDRMILKIMEGRPDNFNLVKRNS